MKAHKIRHFKNIWLTQSIDLLEFYLIYFLNTNYSDYADFTIILEYTDFHIMHFLQKIASTEDIIKLKLMRDT